MKGIGTSFPKPYPWEDNIQFACQWCRVVLVWPARCLRGRGRTIMSLTVLFTDSPILYSVSPIFILRGRQIENMRGVCNGCTSFIMTPASTVTLEPQRAVSKPRRKPDTDASLAVGSTFSVHSPPIPHGTCFSALQYFSCNNCLVSLHTTWPFFCPVAFC